MNLLATILSLTCLILSFTQTVKFHKRTVCRQETWLTGVESLTRGLLSKAKEKETSYLMACGRILHRQARAVSWSGGRLDLNLEGKL